MSVIFEYHCQFESAGQPEALQSSGRGKIRYETTEPLSMFGWLTHIFRIEEKEVLFIRLR